MPIISRFYGIIIMMYWRDDLLLDWTSAQNSEPLMSIKPLE